MIATNQQLVAVLYMAVFNRAPDQKGLGYWTAMLDAGATLIEVADGFLQHPMHSAGLENGSAFGYSSIFKNMFGTFGGMFEYLYWSQNFSQNSPSRVVAEFAQRVFDLDKKPEMIDVPPGAPAYYWNAFDFDSQETYLRTLLNKLDIALSFSTTLGALSNVDATTDITNPQSLLADAAYQASQVVVAAVTSDANSLAEAKSGLAALSPGNALSALTNQTHTLTLAADTFSSSLGSDTYTANGVLGAAGNLVNSLQSIDSLNGGAGVDTLNAVLVTREVVVPVLNSIENINVSFTADGTLSLSKATGVTQVTVKGTSADALQPSVIDASAVTKAIKFDLSALTATSAPLTVLGTAGADTFVLANNAVVTGGAGADRFIVNPTTAFSTITDLAKGDVIAFSNRPFTFLSKKLDFPWATSVLEYLNAAANPVLRSAGQDRVMSWFQTDTDTYLVNDSSQSINFVRGQDAVVKIQGLVDLSTAKFDYDGSLII